MLENAGDAVVVIDAKGKIVHASTSIVKVLGYTVAETRKLDIASIAHPDDLLSLNSVMTQVMANPGVPIKGHTGRMRHADGSWHWYEAVVTNLLHDKDIRGIVDNFRDVTETVLAEEKTKIANRLYNFISQINQAIVQTDSEAELFGETCRIATDLGKFKMAWVGLLNTDRSKISLAQGCGIPAAFQYQFNNVDVWPDGPVSSVLASGKCFVCNDIAYLGHGGWRAFADANGIRSFMVLPIIKDDEIVGALSLYCEEVGFFSEQECRLLEEVATDISFAVNAFERERLRAKAEKRHRDSELRLKQAQSIAHVGSFEIDFSTGTTKWSEELCRIYGFEITNNKHPYNDWLEMVHPLDLPHVIEVAEAAKASLSSSAIYHRIIRKDGSVRHIFSQGEYELDGQGNAVGMHGVAHDITEFKESEGARYQSERNLQLIMDLIPQGIFIKDTKGRFLFVNENFASRYGLSAAEFLLNERNNRSDDELDADLYHQQDQHVIHTGEGITIPELSYTLADGSIRYFYTVKVPFTLSGDSGRGMLGIELDITDRREADLERTRMMADLTKRNKDLEQFSYVVSHNVRAPLVNIISLIALLAPENMGGDGEDILAALKISTNKLDSVIRDLNFILNINHEPTEVMEPVSFSTLISDIKIAIANLIEGSAIVITTDFLEVGYHYCTKSYLHSIFYNLILNAIKYRRKEISSKIHISSVKDAGCVILKFRDNGMGIDLDKFGSQLFGLYKRFHPGIEGKGLGLYMVKTQVEHLKGNISVESLVGEGTTFTLRLKVAEDGVMHNR